jgi:hypothetical protein
LKNGFGLSPSAADLATGASIGSASASMPTLSSSRTCSRVAANSISCVPLADGSNPPSPTSNPRFSSSAMPDRPSSAEYGSRLSFAPATDGTMEHAASDASSAMGARTRM